MTEAEANALIAADKIIDEPIVWTRHDTRRQRYRFPARVVASNANVDLWLVGQANPANWGFVLLGPGNARLRKISTLHTGHVHPDGTEAAPRHKHYWTEGDDDRWTYEPDDIRWDDPNFALVDFITECGIILNHNAPALSFEGDMP